MSKKRKIIITSAVVLVVVAILLSVLLFDSASIGENVKGELYYSDNSTSFCTNITDEESTEIAKMINGKPMHFLDDAVYRFSDEVYLSFEDGEEIKKRHAVRQQRCNRSALHLIARLQNHEHKQRVQQDI